MTRDEANIHFYLEKAGKLAAYALEELTPSTEYLRSELEQHLRSLQTLLEKMEEEEHLRRDRDALHAEPSVGLGERFQ